MRIKPIIFALALAGFGYSGLAMAQNPDAPVTNSAELNALTKQIEGARKAHAAEFAAVKQLREEMPELDARKRGRIAPVGTTLDLLGPNAVWALMDDLIQDKPFANQRPSVRQGWRIGVLHALGRLRNPVARPVLERVVSQESDTWVLRTAAEALGKLQDQEAAEFLIKASAGEGARAEAVLEGMAHCRRLVVTEYLVSRIEQAKADSEKRALVESLRDHANAWAWKTDVVAASGEGEQVRNLSAAALIRTYAKEPQLEKELRKAILIVDSAESVALVQAEISKASAPAAKASLEDLLKALASNPLHKR